MIEDNKLLTYIDLFAGCGGLSLGLYNAGWKGLFAIEKSPDAFKTLKYNLIDNKKHFDWPEWLEQSNHDINDVLNNYENELKELNGQVDLIVGGPPCQGFSTAGRRKEDDIRNGLISSYLEFVKLVNPKIIFFENVKGFTLKFKKNKSKGLQYSNFVVEQLKLLKYNVSGKLIDFSKFGIPQKRIRFILVGIREDIVNNNQVNAAEFFKSLSTNKKQFLMDKELPQNPYLKNALSDLLKDNGLVQTPDRKGFQSGTYSEPRSKYQEYLRRECELKIPNSHSFPKHKAKITLRFEDFIKNQKANKSITVEVRKKYEINKHTIIPLSAKLKAPTITSLPDDYIHYKEPRILTVRECARIQSFPDWFEFQGKYTSGGKLRIKQVPRYTQIANAVPPLFAEQCGYALKKLV